MAESETNVEKSLKHKRAGHLSDVTKKKKLCDEAFLGGKVYQQELRTLVDAFERALVNL